MFVDRYTPHVSMPNQPEFAASRADAGFVTVSVPVRHPVPAERWPGQARRPHLSAVPGALTPETADKPPALAASTGIAGSWTDSGPADTAVNHITGQVSNNHHRQQWTPADVDELWRPRSHMSQSWQSVPRLGFGTKSPKHTLTKACADQAWTSAGSARDPCGYKEPPASGSLSSPLARRLAWSASNASAMRLSCLIATPNPMTVITNPATPIQSATLIFTGSSALIIERGRATFTLFLGDIRIALGAERDLRASAMPLSSAISQPPISQADGAARWQAAGRPQPRRITASAP